MKNLRPVGTFKELFFKNIPQRSEEVRVEAREEREESEAVKTFSSK